MLSLLLRWLLNAVALILVAWLYPGVQVVSVGAALLAALVLGLVNAVIRPILLVLTLPVTILTLGLFIFVVNALCFWLAAEFVGGFHVAGFWAALVGSILYSVITLLTSWIVFGGRK
ncbi:MAG TPA: phage holin family protein [Usitatibacter sp.]|nr:phage holin family protein [Usitatibacter sp.]